MPRLLAKFSPQTMESWRAKIPVGVVINRLSAHVKGEIKLRSTQIRAAEILLRKALPDLSSIAIGSDHDGSPVIIITGVARAGDPDDDGKVIEHSLLQLEQPDKIKP